MPLNVTQDTASVLPNATATGNILANDGDVSANATLTINGTQATEAAQTLTSTFGTLSFAADGSYSYTPHEWVEDRVHILLGRSWTDTFTYEVSDDGTTEQATLAITIGEPASETHIVEYTSGSQTYVYVEDGADPASVRGYAGTPGNSTITGIVRDYDNSESWQYAWDIYAYGGGNISSIGTYNDDGTVTLMAYDSTDAIDWHTREIHSTGFTESGIHGPVARGVAQTDSAAFASLVGAVSHSGANVTEAERNTIQAEYDVISALPTNGTFTSIIDHLDNGNIRTSTFDFLTNAGQPYLSTETNQDGDLVATIVNRADGIVVRTALDAEGTKTSVLQTDVNDIRNWTTHETTYDAEGTQTSLRLVLDGGDVITHMPIDYYDDHKWITHIDNDDSSAWSSHRRTVSTTGDLIGDVLIMDDGVEHQRVFADNKATSIISYDNGASDVWDTYSAQFNAVGIAVFTELELDNGDQIHKRYSDAGALIGNRIIDGSDSRDWSDGAWIYAEDGRLVADGFEFRNGITQARLYDDNGNLDEKYLDDHGENADWATIALNYNDTGGVTQRTTTLDNENIVTQTFNDAGRMLTQNVKDHADTYGWAEATWTFNADGSVASVETSDVFLM